MREKKDSVKRTAAGQTRRAGARRPRARQVVAVCASLAFAAAALQLTAALALGIEGGGLSLASDTAAAGDTAASGTETAGTETAAVETDAAAAAVAEPAGATSAAAEAEPAATAEADGAQTDDAAAQSADDLQSAEVAVAALSAPVTVDDPVCKVVDTNGVNTFSSIADAVTYIAAVSTSSFATQFAGSGGIATIEILKGEVTQTATVNVSLGTSRPMALTTASSTATDGYPYKGDTTAEGGRAVVKRGYYSSSTIAGSLFYLKGSSVVTLTNIVIDGNSSNFSGGNYGGLFALSEKADLTLTDGSLLRNSKAEKNGGAVLLTDKSNTDSLTMNGDAQIDLCSANHGGGIYSEYSGHKIDISGNAKITNCTANVRGGALGIYNTKLSMSGNAELSGNKAGDGCSAVRMNSSATLDMSGNAKITGNEITSSSATADRACAVASDGGGSTNMVVTLSGSATIYGNSNTSSKYANLQDVTSSNDGSMIKVGTAGLNSDAKIGVFASINKTQGATFARTTAASASTVSGLYTFLNDKDLSMVGTAGTGNAVMWTNAVVKETTTASVVKYYASLDKAITGSTDGSTLEILRSHALTGDATTGTKNLTIQNIVTPANDAEDPKKNGSTNDDNGEPIVYFTTGTATDGRITIGSGTAATVTIKGVHFSGKYLNGATVGARSRSASGMAVSANATLNIADGDTAGTYMDGSAHAPAPTIVEDFVNTTTADATAGGFLYVAGSVVWSGGTAQGCKCDSKNDAGGGSVAAVYAGTFTLEGGTITGNGELSTANWKTDGAFKVQNGSTFTMTGGEAYGNYANHGALVTANALVNTVTIAGTAKIHDNTVSMDGGAIFAQNLGATTVNIGGNAEIYNNHAGRAASAIDIRANCSLNLYGNAKIYNNSMQTYAGVANSFGCAICGWAASVATPTTTIKENPQVFGNTGIDGSAMDFWVSAASKVTVATDKIGKGAKVWVYGNTGVYEAGNQFATSAAASASDAGYLAGFYDDRATDAEGYALRGTAGTGNAIVWGTVTPNVKVTEKLSGGDSVHTFATIAEAVECAGALPAANMPTYTEGAGVDGDIMEYYKMEVLIGELTQTAAVPVAVGADKPLMLTTAKTAAAGCTDGYPYRGDTSKESGRAVVKIGATGVGAFKISGASNLTLENCIIDGNKSAGYVIPTDTGAVYSKSSTFVMNDGGEIRNAKQADTNGGIAVQLIGGTFKMRDGSCIKDCENTHNGAVYVSDAAVVTIDGGVISGCTGTYGGAMYIKSGTVTLKGTTQLINNTTNCGAAIFMNESNTESVTKVLNIEGSATVKGNISKEAKFGAYGAIAVPNAASSRVYVKGSPYIYDNWTATGEAGGVQYNLQDPTALNDGTVITIAEEGLNDDAKIGVYATTNYNAGNTFARTATTKSTDYANLSAFVNDKNTRLTGLASAADPYNRVVWSSAEKLVLKKVLPSAVAHDTWFTVQLKDTDSGEVYRQAIKVPAGSTSGTATVLVQSGIAYEVADAAEQSSWRYEADSTSYAGATTTTPADAWTADATKATLGTLTLACPDVSAYNPDTTTTPRTLTMTVKEKTGAQGWYADSASVVNTITMS